MLIRFISRLVNSWNKRVNIGSILNTDVALWLDSRKFQKKPALQEACGLSLQPGTTV